MLYDPKWEGVSLKSFIGWLEAKDPGGRYQFYECEGRCLLGQYMAAMGVPWEGAPEHPSGNWTDSSYAKTGWQLFGKHNTFDVLAKRPHTYGAALKRARKHLAASNGERA